MIGIIQGVSIRIFLANIARNEFGQGPASELAGRRLPYHISHVIMIGELGYDVVCGAISHFRASRSEYRLLCIHP